jgi:hypothetical protein
MAQDPARQGWTLVIGPNVDHETFQRRKQQAGRDADVAKWRHQRDELSKQAAGLEAEVKKLEAKARELRQQADRLGQQISGRMQQLYERDYGRPELGAEHLQFEADEAANAELDAMSPDELVRRLIAIHAAHECAPEEELASKPIRRVSYSTRG